MTDSYKDKISGIGVIIKSSKEQLPLGNKSRGRMLPPEKGRRAILVPSFGFLEKEEIDYIVEGAQEQEDERVKKGIISQQKEELEQVATAMIQAPEGQRAKVGREIIKEAGR